MNYDGKRHWHYLVFIKYVYGDLGFHATRISTDHKYLRWVQIEEVKKQRDGLDDSWVFFNAVYLGYMTDEVMHGTGNDGDDA